MESFKYASTRRGFFLFFCSFFGASVLTSEGRIKDTGKDSSAAPRLRVERGARICTSLEIVRSESVSFAVRVIDVFLQFISVCS